MYTSINAQNILMQSHLQQLQKQEYQTLIQLGGKVNHYQK
jgi:hypothetical protein